MIKQEPFRTFTWTEAQLAASGRYTQTGQMRIICSLRDDLFEDRYVCLIDCDDRVNLLLHFL
jgi:hypothetical protein